ncbi:carbohydrate ABC transporter permease [Actinocatenispora rupis]|uniref:Sugar ABC transporter permease n=1 Tax=Actinocatenispora rupis TaxID=519421 RepID=A0A8J3J085_9ACTN|nr:sugar ABC transporter permease [Actinocatenispora rupis]GID09557.1 sugar ABC transporter permease [Actinocatenispora rupis]
MVSQVRGMRKRRAGVRSAPAYRGDKRWAYLLLLPSFAGLVLFYLWPAVKTLYLSFTNVGPFGGSTWTGLSNYTALVHDDKFVRSMVNTVLYAGVVVVVGIPLAIAIAALLNTSGLRGKTFYRTLYFLPVVTMPAAVGMVWQWLYNGDYGLINYLLSVVGIGGPRWLTTAPLALFAIAVVGIWMGLGNNIIILLAGLQGIPKELYEAADVDGASRFTQFRKITVPMLSPSIFFVTVLSVINTLQVFDLLFLMMSKTNPALPETETIVYLFYERAFVDNQRGAAAAVSFVLFVLMLIITAVQFRLQRKWVHYA